MPSDPPLLHPRPVPPPLPPRPRLAPVHRLPLRGADDAVIARALVAGDEAAAAAAWDRYAPVARSVLRRTLGPFDDVEDEVQEVFLRFFRQVPELRDPHALRPFLIGIAMHVAVSTLRKRRVRRWLHLTPTGVLPDVAARASTAATGRARPCAGSTPSSTSSTTPAGSRSCCGTSRGWS